METSPRVTFGIKGFCEHCGVYRRPGLTHANYVDEFGRQHRKALICSDCYAQLVSGSGDNDEHNTSQADPD